MALLMKLVVTMTLPTTLLSMPIPDPEKLKISQHLTNKVNKQNSSHKLIVLVFTSSELTENSKQGGKLRNEDKNNKYMPNENSKNSMREYGTATDGILDQQDFTENKMSLTKPSIRIHSNVNISLKDDDIESNEPYYIPENKKKVLKHENIEIGQTVATEEPIATEKCNIFDNLVSDVLDIFIHHRKQDVNGQTNTLYDETSIEKYKNFNKNKVSRLKNKKDKLKKTVVIDYEPHHDNYNQSIQSKKQISSSTIKAFSNVDLNSDMTVQDKPIQGYKPNEKVDFYTDDEIYNSYEEPFFNSSFMSLHKPTKILDNSTSITSMHDRDHSISDLGFYLRQSNIATISETLKTPVVGYTLKNPVYSQTDVTPVVKQITSLRKNMFLQNNDQSYGIISKDNVNEIDKTKINHDFPVKRRVINLGKKEIDMLKHNWLAKKSFKICKSSCLRTSRSICTKLECNFRKMKKKFKKKCKKMCKKL